MKNNLLKFVLLLSCCFIVLTVVFVFSSEKAYGLLDDITGGLVDTFGPDTPSTSDIYNDAKKLSSGDMSFPSVNYTVMPANNIRSGEIVTLSANPMFFSPDVDIPKHINWCIDDLPMSGKVAGSKDDIKGSEGNYYLENRYGRIKGGNGLCRLNEIVNNSDYKAIEDITKSADPKMKAPDSFYMTRIPNQDSDGDGLDDAWESAMFAGRRIPETNNYYPSADEAGALLAAIKPGDDPDKDGWEFTYTDAKGSGGTPPNEQTEYSLFKAPWMMGLVYAKGNITGDNKWTNFEEFVFDTDPLSSDTDQDGVKDEADASGMNQQTLSLRINKQEESSYNVVLYAFGSSARWAGDRKNSGRQWSKYFRADFPNRRSGEAFGKANYWENNGLKKTQDGANQLRVGASMPRQIQLGYTPFPAVRGEDVEVKAAAVSLSKDQTPNFIYNWFLGGNKINEQSGLNKDIFKFKPGNPNTCQEIVGVEVTDDLTKKTDYREIEVPLGLGLDDFKNNVKIIGNVRFNQTNEDISDFNSKNKAAGAEIDPASLVNKNDPYIGEVNKDDIGFRKGDLLEISASGLKNNYNPACFGGAAYDQLLNDVNFIWTLNGTEMKAKSGQGGGFSKIQFIIVGDPWTDYKNLSSDTDLGKGHEALSLDVIDQTGNLVAKKTEKIKVSTPYIHLSAENADKESSGTGKDLDKTVYSAGEGKKVKINAHLYNFRPSKEGFTYRWIRNGAEVAKEEGVESNTASYEFKVGYDESGQKNSVGQEEIVLKIESLVDQDLYEKEEATDTVLVSIPERTEGGGGVISGALGRLAPSYYKAAFNIAFIPALIAIIMLFGFEFVKVRRKE